MGVSGEVVSEANCGGAVCERSEQWRVWASEASGGGAAGRPRIVAEGDVLRVFLIFTDQSGANCTKLV